MQSLSAFFNIKIIGVFKKYKEPNKFYIGQQCLLEEALTFSTEHADACSGIVEEARCKYKSSSSNKELMRKMNKTAKIVEVDSY
jgi:hypothetical protein